MLTARDNQRAATEAAARTLAVGAEALTTDGATLQSGGWELQAARAPVGQLPQPANLVATGGDLEGTVDLSWDALRRGVQTYIAQQALSPSGPWTQCQIGRATRLQITKLQNSI